MIIKIIRPKRQIIILMIKNHNKIQLKIKYRQLVFINAIDYNFSPENIFYFSSNKESFGETDVTLEIPVPNKTILQC